MTRPPRYRDAMIGRLAERQRIDAWLDLGRPVQVLGPGGVGKTRLAVEVATGRRGSLFVDLSLASGMDDVLASVSEALREPLDRHDPVGALVRLAATLGQRTLVLDNAEQVDAAVSTLIDRLRSGAPDLRLLCTSRARLDARDLEALDLEPLPPESSVELVLQLVPRRPIAPIHPTADRPMLLELAHALSGLPLALELAAPRLELLPLPMLLERIRTGPGQILRSADGRTSLWEALDRSMSLLGESQRSALAQLGVFHGEIPLDAAESVLRVPDAHAVDCLHLLVRHSLLHACEPVDDMPRFRVLGVIGQHAHDLHPSERTAAEDRHAHFYLEHAPSWSASRRRAEYPNLAAIRTRAVEAAPDARRRRWAVPAMASMIDHLQQRYAISYVIDQVQQTLALPDDVPLARAELLQTLAHQYRHQNRLTEAIEAQGRARDLAEQAGDFDRALAMSGFLVNLYGLDGKRDRTIEGYRDILARARERGNDRVEALARLAIALSGPVYDNDWGAAEQMCLEALEPARRSGDAHVEGRVWYLLAECSLQAGDAAAGLERIENALAAEGPGATVPHVTDLLVLAQLHELDNDTERSHAALDRARDLAERLKYQPPMLTVMEAWRDLGAGEAGAALERLTRTPLDPGTWIADRQNGLLMLTRALAHAALGDPEQTEATLADASRTLARGNAETAEALRPTLSSLSRGDSDPPERGPTTSTPLRLVGGVIDRIAAQKRAADEAWRVSTDGRRAHQRTAGAVDLSRRAAPARILAALLESRERDASAVLGPEEVFAAGWPGQTAFPGSMRNRVYVAMTTLRKAGLHDLIEKVDGGYRLDPSIQVRRMDDEV